MKVCFVLNNLDPSAGWGRLAINAAEAFKNLGNQTGFIIENGQNQQSVIVLPMKLSFSNIFKLTGSLWKIRKFVSQYDVVVCYDPNPYGIIVSLACIGLRTKVVVYAIGTYSLMGRSRIKNLLMGWAFNRADRVFVVSDFLRQQIERSGFRIKNYEVMPVGVDVNYFKPAHNTSHFTNPYIISVGALKYRKGYHVSIPAFKLIADKYPSLKYIIVGRQDLVSYFNKLQVLVKELDLESRVVFLEKITDKELVQYYNHASLFLLTPITTTDALEGFGMVYLEAGACGKPVIGTLGTGAEAAILDGETGFLTEGEPSSIATAMDKILQDETLATKMGSNGIKRANQFSWGNIAKTYQASFRKLVEKK